MRKAIDSFGYIVHPVLFALFPLLAFYGTNLEEARSGDFNLSALVLLSLLLVMVGWTLGWLVTRNRLKASLLAAVFVSIFLNLGRLSQRLSDFALDTPAGHLGPNEFLLGLSALVLIALWLIIRRLTTSTASTLTYILILFSCVLVASTLISIVPALFRQSRSEPRAASPTTNQSQRTSRREGPDVYYIILDGYARADMLQDEYGYDNSPFLDALEDRGFYVAGEAHSNYGHTFLSAASTFNMRYLNYLGEKYGEDSTDKREAKQLVVNSRVVSTFKSFGYGYAAIGSDWHGKTESTSSDVVLKRGPDRTFSLLGVDIDEFASVYLQTTALNRWVVSRATSKHVARILDEFERLEKVATVDRSTLAIAHILVPHFPYLFDSEGVIPNKTELDLQEDGYSDREAFLEQTLYTNKLALETIDRILRLSPDPPIIVLASDHGPAPIKLDANNLESVRVRMSILNAYFFPDGDYSSLYPSITPVNSFRLILKRYFQQDLELLPDRVYFTDSNREHLYRFHDFTDALR